MRTFSGLLLCALALPALAQRGGDLQARIVYAYQTEDLNALRDLRQTLGAKLAAGADGAALRYYLAQADYRYAQLDGRAAQRGAAAAAADCVAQLGVLLKRRPRSAEALTLQGACDGELAASSRFEGPLLRARADRRLREALRIDPHNPRALYLKAQFALARSKPGSAAAARALLRLRRAVRSFEHTSATSPDAPGWGHAEAYLALGHQLRLRGDVLGARNWIERALLAAPAYKAARRELAILETR
ncbi:MAG TPA: hypothetical protein VND80_12100 [Steroidobacteraceae bacterium]|nr:hypothetical protein [Steroidobacteraceae bacterium]